MNVPQFPSHQSLFRPGRVVTVHDPMQHHLSNHTNQQKYTHYTLSSPVGDFSEWDQLVGRHPNLSPKEMLQKGVFEGRYLNNQQHEFPQSWFKYAKLSSIPNPELNYFGIRSRQPLRVWKEKNWLLYPDPRGWFQWYCRYYVGRRLPEIDKIQIRRWASFVARHEAQVRRHCGSSSSSPLKEGCRLRQRQGLLQWGWWIE